MALKEKIESFFRNRFVRYFFAIPLAFSISDRLLYYHDLPMRNAIIANNYIELVKNSTGNNKELERRLADIFIADSTLMKLEPEELEKLSTIFIIDGKYYWAERTGYIAEARYVQRDSIYMDNSLLADAEFRKRIKKYIK